MSAMTDNDAVAALHTKHDDWWCECGQRLDDKERCPDDVKERKQVAARVAACFGHDALGVPDRASGFATCSKCGAILTDGPRKVDADDPDTMRAALQRVARYFGDGPLTVEDGIVTRPTPMGKIVVLPPASWAEGAADLLERALYIRSMSSEDAAPVEAAIRDHLNHSMRTAGDSPGACVFPGCVSTDRHWHGGFPGGYENPAEPDGPPVPFTSAPAPGVRDYNGALLPTSKYRCETCGCTENPDYCICGYIGCDPEGAA